MAGLEQLDNRTLYEVHRRADAIARRAWGERLRRGFKPVELTEQELVLAKESGKYQVVPTGKRGRAEDNSWLWADVEDFADFG